MTTLAATNSTTLTTTSCFNPYFLSGRQIDRIFFFKDNKIICSVGWFGSNNNYPTMVIPAEIKRKNTVDFSSNKPFFVTIKDGYDKGKLNLYLPADIVNLKDNGESVYFDNDNETQYKQDYSIEIECSKSELRLKDGHTHDDYKPYEYITAPIEKRTIEFNNYTRNVKKDKYIQDKELKEIIKDIANVYISLSELQDILKYFNVTRK